MLVNNPIEYALQLDKIFQGEKVECPHCKNGILAHKFYADKKERIGFAQFHCPKCDTDAHLSRVQFQKMLNLKKCFKSSVKFYGW